MPARLLEAYPKHNECFHCHGSFIASCLVKMNLKANTQDQGTVTFHRELMLQVGGFRKIHLMCKWLQVLL